MVFNTVSTHSSPLMLFFHANFIAVFHVLCLDGDRKMSVLVLTLHFNSLLAKTQLLSTVRSIRDHGKTLHHFLPCSYLIGTCMRDICPDVVCKELWGARTPWGAARCDLFVPWPFSLCWYMGLLEGLF